MCCDVIEPSYTKEIEQILKAGENVDFMNQSKQLIESRDCTSQSIFVKKPCDRLVQIMFIIRHQITTNRNREVVYFVSSETDEHLINILMLGCKIGFNLILYLLLANLQFVSSHSRAIVLR